MSSYENVRYKTYIHVHVHVHSIVSTTCILPHTHTHTHTHTLTGPAGALSEAGASECPPWATSKQINTWFWLSRISSFLSLTDHSHLQLANHAHTVLHYFCVHPRIDYLCDHYFYIILSSLRRRRRWTVFARAPSPSGNTSMRRLAKRWGNSSARQGPTEKAYWQWLQDTRWRGREKEREREREREGGGREAYIIKLKDEVGMVVPKSTCTQTRFVGITYHIHYIYYIIYIPSSGWCWLHVPVHGYRFLFVFCCQTKLLPTDITANWLWQSVELASSFQTLHVT